MEAERLATLTETVDGCDNSSVLLDPEDHHFLGRVHKPAHVVREELAAAEEHAAEQELRAAGIVARKAAIADSEVCQT